jgi:hypothetical protein
MNENAGRSGGEPLVKSAEASVWCMECARLERLSLDSADVASVAHPAGARSVVRCAACGSVQTQILKHEENPKPPYWLNRK